MKKGMMVFAAAMVSAATMGASMSAFAANISVDQAKKIALEEAGRAESEVVFKKAEKDYDDGREVFEVEFMVPGKVKYEYDVDAHTGAVVDQDLDDWEADDYVEYAWLLK